MQPTAIVLHGPTSGGKTTLAKALQATSPVPAFHVSLDTSTLTPEAGAAAIRKHIGAGMR